MLLTIRKKYVSLSSNVTMREWKKTIVSMCIGLWRFEFYKVWVIFMNFRNYRKKVSLDFSLQLIVLVYIFIVLFPDWAGINNSVSCFETYK